jgi:hypothetical protein
MNEKTELIKRSVTFTDKQIEFINNKPGINFSDRLRRYLDKSMGGKV